jgi:hypothetical protein
VHNFPDILFVLRVNRICQRLKLSLLTTWEECLTEFRSLSAVELPHKNLTPQSPESLGKSECVEHLAVSLLPSSFVPDRLLTDVQDH